MPLVDNPAKPPYSDVDDNQNQKTRQVYCGKCVYRMVTNLAAPKCGYCGNSLYTVVKSLITQEMLDNELGRGNSNSAR